VQKTLRAKRVTQRFIVYEEICRAHGVTKGIPPKLEITNDSSITAEFRAGGEYAIVISEKYEICRELGQDSLSALACILGHELIHFFHNHKCASFAKQLGKAEAASHSKAVFEKDADVSGLFYAMLAGYSPKVFPALVEKIYRQFDIKDSGEYPSLEQRQKAAQEILEKVDELYNIFEAGQLLFALRYYAQAESCFEYLLRKDKFPAREIYNNAELFAFAQALSLKPPKDFQYPLLIDTRIAYKKQRE
jgi:hypothetical protein